jgi:hypothetical protein
VHDAEIGGSVGMPAQSHSLLWARDAGEHHGYCCPLAHHHIALVYVNSPGEPHAETRAALADGTVPAPNGRGLITGAGIPPS